MRTIALPYYRSSLDLHVDEKNLEAVVTAKIHEYKAGKSEEALVREALDNPIGTSKLRDMAKGKNRIVLITSDHTRAVPSKITLPILLGEIRAGNPDADISILVATGLHRPTTQEELRKMFGDHIVDTEKIAINDAFKDEDFVHMGGLPSGAQFYLNRIAHDCDLLVAEGFIEPHFFAGFSGGRKSVFPGACSAATVNENHCFKALASPFAMAGILENNPVHIDMVHGARTANLAFIMNVALDGEKKIIAAFAGDMEEAHLKGCDFIRELSQGQKVAGDIVVTSNGGYPLDQNVYQTPKAGATAEACCKEGAVIIMVASCSDGMGGTHFEEIMLSGTPEEIEKRLSALDPDKSIPEQWSAQIYARILKKHKTILVTTFLDHDIARKANFIPASTPDEALALAYEMKGKDARVVVIPDGVAVLAVK